MQIRYLAFLLIAASALAQSSPQFEVATVKQVDRREGEGPRKVSAQPQFAFLGKSGNLFQIAGNRVTITGSLHYLMQAAYGVKPWQITGLPPWAERQLYTVTAKTEGEAVATQEQVRPMMQTLLADRFQLKINHESKEMPVYLLTPARKNIGLTQSKPDESFDWDISTSPAGIMRSRGTKESIADFVDLVTMSADRPVIDRTGMTGLIDYDISFSMQDVKTADEANRAILYAIRDQLGLKLDSSKQAVETFAVEHAQQPSDN